MPARFADIKFNLMRAIELFEDMNHLDMDVMAPPSAPNFYKEIEVAQRLNIYLGQLIEEGVFEDCELRDGAIDDEEEDVEDGDEDDEDSDDPPRSEGFDYSENGHARDDSQSQEVEDRGSRESFTDRFKRYIRRIIPGGRRRSEAEHDHDHHNHDGHRHHHHLHQHNEQERSRSESGGIRPFNATISSGSHEDEDYDEQSEGIYDPSSTSFDGSDSVHDGHPIHEHHRQSSGSTIKSSDASGSARDSVIDTTESELDDAPLSPRSRSTSRSSTLSTRRSSSGASRRSGGRSSSIASSRSGRARSANSRASSRSVSRTGSRTSRRQSTASRGSRRSSRGRRSR